MGPQPRQRLYTTRKAYGRLLTDVATGRANRGEGDLESLEAGVAAFVGARFAAAAPMARTGIYLALRALLPPTKRKVILSPYTISDVVNMVVCAGGEPVFADIEAETGNIDAGEVERLIDGNTGAVLATHFYGLACDVERIQRICALAGVALIEDAAQAFGTRVHGRHVGSFGDAGVFSFGLFKNVTSFLGGMVVSGKQEVIEHVRNGQAGRPFAPAGELLARMANGAVNDVATYPPVFGPLTFPIVRAARLHGVEAVERQFAFDRDPRIKQTIPERYLHRMTPAQARIVLPQIDSVDSNAAIRIRAAQLYHEGLSGIADLGLPPMRLDGSHTYQYYAIRCPDREALVTFALGRGRDIAVSHHRNCAEMDCFAAFARVCSNAARAAREVVYLPTYPGYGEAEVAKNISVIREFFGAAR